jgi:ubiquinone/menaquinone biosynthesis C-methylase UbiE
VYEQIAAHFSRTRSISLWPRVRDFIAALPSGSTVVDVGCGNGKYMHLGANSVAFTGCDTSESLLRICMRRKYDVQQASALHLPYRSASFDAALHIAVVHHLASPQRRRDAMRELLRVLRPGGRALIYVWSAETGGGRERRWKEAARKAMESGGDGDNDDVDIDTTQDVFVPWSNAKKTTSFKRYYHLFRRGELNALLASVSCGDADGGGATSRFRIIETGKEKENHFVVAQRVSLNMNADDVIVSDDDDDRTANKH